MRIYDDTLAHEFSVRGCQLDGVLEDAETFLDLRSLASLRVVVGPDALCGKMFSAVVARGDEDASDAVCQRGPLE